MAGENEKKLLQKLKEDLEKIRPDVFESGGDVVDNLKEEFEEDTDYEPSEKLEPFSMKELIEEGMKKEALDDDFKKTEENYPKNESLTTAEKKGVKPENAEIKQEPAQTPSLKIEEKIAPTPDEPVIAKTAAEPTPTIITPLPMQTPTNPLIIAKPKKKSNYFLTFLFILLPLLIIGGVIYYFYLM